MTRPLACLSSMATRRLLVQLAGEAERALGLGLEVRSMGGVDAARLVRAGEPVDIVVLASGVMAALEAEGCLLPGSRVNVALSEMAVAVPSGAGQPAIGDEQALKDALRAASGIGYSTGPSGDHLKALIARWGLAAVLQPRLVQAPPGVPVAALLARGDVAIGIQQRSEFVGAPGIAIVGPLPETAQHMTAFTGGIAASSSRPEAARRVLGWWASDATVGAKEACGLSQPQRS